MSESVEIRVVESQLTASATAGHGRVTVLVNADNVILETTFAQYIEDLDYPEIAAAITEAQQRAAAELTRKMAEVLDPPLTLAQSSAEPSEVPVDDDTDTGDFNRGVFQRAW